MKYRLLLITLLLPWSAMANPFDAYGVGSRNVALGGAGTASVRDSSANYYNPAALTKVPGLRLDLGYSYIQPELLMNNGNLEVDRISGVYTGVTLPKKILEQTLAVSLSFFLPDDRLTRIRSLPQEQPRFTLFDNRPQRVVIITSAAWEPLEGFSIGAGLTYLTNTGGTVNIDGTLNIAEPDQTLLMGGIDVAFDSVRYPTASIHWDIDRHWSVGMTFRDSFELSLNLTVAANVDVTADEGPDAEKFIEDGVLALSSSSKSLFSPRQISAGIQYQNETWLVTADVTWHQWSRFQAPASLITIGLDTGDTDFPIPETAPIIDPNFHDIIVARIGLENEIFKNHSLRILSRVGYFYEPTPAPKQSETTNYADANKHGTSLGLGLEVLNLKPILELPLVIDWSFQAIWLEPREYNKDNPADLVGDYHIHGVVLGSSLTVGVQF